jgi:hypothetical protein
VNYVTPLFPSDESRCDSTKQLSATNPNETKLYDKDPAASSAERVLPTISKAKEVPIGEERYIASLTKRGGASRFPRCRWVVLGSTGRNDAVRDGAPSRRGARSRRQTPRGGSRCRSPWCGRGGDRIASDQLSIKEPAELIGRATLPYIADQRDSAPISIYSKSETNPSPLVLGEHTLYPSSQLHWSRENRNAFRTYQTRIRRPSLGNGPRTCPRAA